MWLILFENTPNGSYYKQNSSVLNIQMSWLYGMQNNFQEREDIL